MESHCVYAQSRPTVKTESEGKVRKQSLGVPAIDVRRLLRSRREAAGNGNVLSAVSEPLKVRSQAGDDELLLGLLFQAS